MRKAILIIILCILAGCASTPKKEYEWYTPEGDLATPEQVEALKAGCDYEKKMEEVGKQMKIAISVGRYDSQYGKKGSDKYTEKAAEITTELHTCLRKDGYYTKEKVRL